jgi:hypothetical protein
MFTIFPPKVKSTLEQAMKSQKGSRGTALPFFNLDAVPRVEGQREALTALPLRKRNGAQCTVGWVGPRADMDGCGKSPPPPPTHTHTPGFGSRIVQLVARLYNSVLKNIYLRCLTIKERQEGGGSNEGAVN